MRKALKIIGAWLLAVVIAALLGSLVQTQFNIHFLRQLDVPVTAGDRLSMTLQDLVNFAPLWAVLAAVALLLGFLVARALLRVWPKARTPLYTLAGVSALMFTIVLMNSLLQINVIAATRMPLAVLLMSLAGALAGWVFARLTADAS